MLAGKEGETSREMLSLKGKSAIVTGAASGIGRAIAQVFAERGAQLLIADIDEKGGQETVELITQSGGVAIFHLTDVSKDEDVKAMAAFAVEQFGKIDILVNNAAAFIFGKVEDITRDDWYKVLGVNLIGYANCVREVLTAMRRAGGGAIVNIASQSAFIAQAEFIPYNASKGAVLQLNRCLAMDLASDNIRVNAISPGEIRTPATDRHIKFHNLDPEQALRDFGKRALLGRMGTTREVAYAALFLASSEASYITGANLVVDGGATID